MIESLECQDLSNLSLSKQLFPEFNKASVITKSKEFNNCSLTIRSKQRAVKHSVGYDDYDLRKIKYIEYLNKLKEHIEKWFYRGTYNNCKIIGNILTSHCG